MCCGGGGATHRIVFLKNIYIPVPCITARRIEVATASDDSPQSHNHGAAAEGRRADRFESEGIIKRGWLSTELQAGSSPPVCRHHGAASADPTLALALRLPTPQAVRASRLSAAQPCLAGAVLSLTRRIAQRITHANVLHCHELLYGAGGSACVLVLELLSPAESTVLGPYLQYV